MKRCLIALTAAAAILTGCGGDSTPPRDTAHAGGRAVVSFPAFPDSLDPAVSYQQETWQAIWNVYTPLLTYRRAEGVEGSKLIPGLAEALPRVSADRRTYRLRLRRGLRYSDGRPVRASDFEHTIKRVLMLESGGSGFYLGIEGAQRYLERGRASADIPGITADDGTGDIVIRLAQPDSTFANALAMTFAGLVPADAPFEQATARPLPGTGPFEVTDVRLRRGFSLVRNPRYRELPGVPAARLDRIDVDVVRNAGLEAQDIARNRRDLMIDPPPPEAARLARSAHADRYKEFTTNSTYYLFLNTREKPFDDKRVRQAVNHAIDKRALARLFGGLLEPSCNFLPPGMVGYRKIDPCPYGAPDGGPDVAKARALVQDAGAAGAKVTVWGNSEEPAKQVTEYVADTLRGIGLDARPKVMVGEVYGQTVSNQSTKAQIGLMNWFQDFPHPKNFLFLMDSSSIQPVHNMNVSNVADAAIDRALDEADRAPDLAAAAQRYAALDRHIVEEAYIAPYGHRKLTAYASDRIDFARCTPAHPVFGIDLARLCLRP